MKHLMLATLAISALASAGCAALGLKANQVPNHADLSAACAAGNQDACTLDSFNAQLCQGAVTIPSGGVVQVDQLLKTICVSGGYGATPAASPSRAASPTPTLAAAAS